MIGKASSIALVLCAAAAAWPGAGAAAAQGGSGDRLSRGIEAHNAALSGDAGALDEALLLLGTEGWQRPAIGLAYHGSALTIEASREKKAGRLAAALGLVDSGLKEIDEAVVREPGSKEARLLRLENSLALAEESPVDRSMEAKEDIAFLRARWADLASEERSIVELDDGRLALFRKSLNEAMGHWRKSTLEAPESPAAGRARGLLARYGD